MPLGVIVVEGAQYSGPLITARLVREFGREVVAVPGNVTQPANLAANPWIKQGAKLVTNGEGVEELPTSFRSALVRAQQAARRLAKLQREKDLRPPHRRGSDPNDDIVEGFALDSSQALATRFDLERKGVIRQLPGRQFCQVLR
jgi:DNA processing protein